MIQPTHKQKLEEVLGLSATLVPPTDTVAAMTTVRTCDPDGSIKFSFNFDRTVSGCLYWVLRWAGGRPLVMVWNATLEDCGASTIKMMRYGGDGNLIMMIDLSKPPAYSEEESISRPDALLASFKPTVEVCRDLLRAVKFGEAAVRRPVMPVLHGVWPADAGLYSCVAELSRRIVACVTSGEPPLACLTSRVSGRITSIADDEQGRPVMTVATEDGGEVSQIFPRKAIMRRDLICVPDMNTGALDIEVRKGAQVAYLPGYPNATPEILHAVWGKAFQELWDMEFAANVIKSEDRGVFSAPVSVVSQTPVEYEERFVPADDFDRSPRWRSKVYVGSAAWLINDSTDFLTVSERSWISSRRR